MKFKALSVFLAFAFLALGLNATAAAQDDPVYESYRGIKIGMTTDAVREKLGKPSEEFETEDYFEFENGETARVFYEPDKTVRVISAIYSGDLSKAPVPKTVVGEDLPARDDGGMYKMVQYPKSGFWITYVKTGGENGMVVITMQKMPKA